MDRSAGIAGHQKTATNNPPELFMRHLRKQRSNWPVFQAVDVPKARARNYIPDYDRGSARRRRKMRSQSNAEMPLSVELPTFYLLHLLLCTGNSGCSFIKL